MIFQVKAVREAMNEMLEVWKMIPHELEDGSPPPQSNDSSRGKFSLLSVFLCLIRNIKLNFFLIGKEICN